MYYVENRGPKAIPLTIEERKELFKKLNEQEGIKTIKMKNNLLQKKEIVDIPGIFDHSNDNTYKKSFKPLVDDLLAFLFEMINDENSFSSTLNEKRREARS